MNIIIIITQGAVSRSEDELNSSVAETLSETTPEPTQVPMSTILAVVIVLVYTG